MIESFLLFGKICFHLSCSEELGYWKLMCSGWNAARNNMTQPFVQTVKDDIIITFESERLRRPNVYFKSKVTRPF